MNPDKSELPEVPQIPISPIDYNIVVGVIGGNVQDIYHPDMIFPDKALSNLVQAVLAMSKINGKYTERKYKAVIREVVETLQREL